MLYGIFWFLDVYMILELMYYFGIWYVWVGFNSLMLYMLEIENIDVFYVLVSKMWVSFIVLGVILVWVGMVIVSMLGGCVWGLCLVD